jgi:hypothetical protein
MRDGGGQNREDNAEPVSALDGLRRGEHSTSNIE